ncbi:MAG TPA: nucleoside deaminase [Chryseosolibacter sp.]
MKRAIDLSLFALEQNHGDPFGSVIVKNGIIVGEGWNKKQLRTDPSAHAEMEAVRDACKKLQTTSLQGCEVYASAQPCPMCLAALYLSGVEKIYYCIPSKGIEELNKNLSVQFIYDALSKEASQRPIPEIQIQGEEADDLVRRYRKLAP